MKVGPRNYRIHSQRCVQRVLHLKLKASGQTKFGLKFFTRAIYILPLWNPLDIFCCVGYNLQFTILIYKSTHLLPDANCSNSNLHFHVRKSLFKHSLPFFYFQLRNFEIRKNTVLKSIVLLWLNTNWWWQIVKIYEYEYDMIWGYLTCPFVVICCGFAPVEVAF